MRSSNKTTYRYVIWANQGPIGSKIGFQIKVFHSRGIKANKRAELLATTCPGDGLPVLIYEICIAAGQNDAGISQKFWHESGNGIRLGEIVRCKPEQK